MNWQGASLKRGIHGCSTLEFLEHGEQKPIVKVKNLGNLEQMIGSGGIQNPKRHLPNSNLGPRCEATSKTKDLATPGPRVQARNKTRNPSKGWEEFYDLEPFLKTNFGASVNDVPHFST
ncbi:hypothetical protein AVEN_117088-1 [Araneus ventricosus]|uniref:Uncharacterized protein n=1 Tax=Araneus ventricosus TaxID=182803 RepID=A0A4Y2NRS2_ARAVE|nr:hypothetical protein AVEN_117088-1 [Araneus ventricosus]